MKKFLMAVLSLFMVMTLVGCSNSTPSDGGNTDGGSEDGIVTIKLGGSGPTSGGAAVYGQAVYNGALLAVNEINALNSGFKFDFRFEDDAHDPEKAVSAYGALKDWGMQLSLSCTTSGPAATVSPMLAEDKIFAITPSGSNPAVTFADILDPTSYFGNVFQMCFTDPSQGELSAQYIKEHNLASNVAVIYKNDDNYSKGIYDTFVEGANEYGLNIVYTGTFDDSSATDFSVQVSEANKNGADLVFLPMYYEPAALIMDRANKDGCKPIFFGVDGMDGILTLAGFDTSLAEGTYLLTPFSADAKDDFTANFVKNFKEQYGETPIQFAADAYDCVYAIYQALQNANVTGGMSNEELCDAMVKEFTSMTFTGTTGTSKWEVTGEVSKSPMAVRIENGVYVGQ